jgi:hypothetical protein
MSCASDTCARTIVEPRTSLCLLAYSGAVAGSSSEREIHHASPLAPDGSRLTASRVIPDTTKADPEHIWGDEGPVNE